MYVYSLDIAAIVVTGAGQAVVDDLTDEGFPVDRTCLLVPGSIAWDSCECGQLAQSITNVVPASVFGRPAADDANTPCGPAQVQVSTTLSLTRCVPGPGESGAPPACAELLAAGLQLERDRFIVRRALRCYLKTLFDAYQITGFSVGSATSVGPEGMCAGVEVPYSFGLAAGNCCG